MRTIITALSFIVLSGCVSTASQGQLNTAMQKADQVAANCGMEALPPELVSAWDRAEELDQQQCPQGSEKKPLTATERETTLKCWKNIVQAQVSPVSKNKTALTRILNKSGDSRHKQIFADYDAKKISREQVGKLLKNLWDKDWAEYASKEVSYYNLAQCQNRALAQHVMPVYHNKGILADFMAKRSEIALNVDEGKLSPQKADVQIQKAMASFLNSEQHANTAIQAQQEQAWQNYSMRLQQLSAQVSQTERMQAQQCDAIDIAPIASPGCKNVCINGGWAEVCG